MKRFFLVIVFLKLVSNLFALDSPRFSALFTGDTSADEGTLKLWYTTPANAEAKDNPYVWGDDKEWLKALPVGNGYMGAMVFGDVVTDRLQLNDKNLWSGSPEDASNPEFYPSLGKVRELLSRGRNREAQELAEKGLICKGVGTNRARAAHKPFGCFQTLGDLFIDFHEKGKVYDDYSRQLDLENGLMKVSYAVDGNKIERTCFASYPDRVIVFKIKSHQKGKLSFSARMNRPERYKLKEDQGQLLMYGTMDNGAGGDGMKYWVRLDVSLSGGKKEVTDSTLTVTGADEACLYLTSVTDYVGAPEYLKPDFSENTAQILQDAMKKPFSKLLQTHIQDHSSLFKRVDLNLTSKNFKDTIPTDIRVENVRKGQVDLHLQTLLFQYGRYQLIASSRKNTLPANLQGVWCNKINSAWNGDYHMDINLQMNYWLAQVTNLPELFESYVAFLESLQASGQKTAMDFYRSTGWCVHPVVNVWGFTAPGERVGWGLHVGAAGWLCQNLWEEYAFTQNRSYLERIYPILSRTAQFYSDWLVYDTKTGRYISTPSISPENRYKSFEGDILAVCNGATHDHQVIRDFYINYLKASDLLDKKDPLIDLVKKQLALLPNSQIGSDGRIMEWDREYEEPEPGHRHISHLYGLFPGDQITPDIPDLYKAARRSLDHRIKYTKGQVGWNLAWLICVGARFQDSRFAYDALMKMQKFSMAENLFTFAPPFQIEAGLGITTGMAEMLLQSHGEKGIHLLPALPEAWSEGRVKGLCARGGYEVSMKWNDGKLVSATILSKVKEDPVTITYNGKSTSIQLKKGTSRTLAWKDFGDN